MSIKEEEAVIGSSKLKMKIKFSHSSSSSSSSPAHIPIPSDTQLPNNYTEQNSSDPIIPSPTQTPSPPRESPSTMGKRKRKKKPKKMDDEFICDSPKRIQKTPFFKSDHDVGSIRGLALSRNNNSSNGAQNHDNVTTRTMIRAEEIQSTLGSEFPSFTKIMNRSHVLNGWMGVPGEFGNKEHLPRKTIPVILVDESGKEFELSYNGKKRGLSAGWRNFAIEQKLVEYDVLIFQLVEIEPCKFKVYVVRANDSKDVDGALSLLNLEALIEQNDAENDRDENRAKALSLTYKKKRMKSLQASTILMKKRKRRMISVAKTSQLAKKIENGNKPTYPSSSPPNFENIENFQDFTIMVDGLCIDSELPEDIRAKYYDLCSAKNDFLHARLREGLNSKLIAGIICETVNLSEAIRTCSLMTSEDEFENWVKTLKSFELLGMSVGFLRERVGRLLELAFISEEAFERRKYVEAKVGRAQVENEIVNLETKIIELKVASDKYSADVQSLKYKAESFELKFQEEVDALW